MQSTQSCNPHNYAVHTTMQSTKACNPHKPCNPLCNTYNYAIYNKLHTMQSKQPCRPPCNLHNHAVQTNMQLHNRPIYTTVQTTQPGNPHNHAIHMIMPSTMKCTQPCNSHLHAIHRAIHTITSSTHPLCREPSSTILLCYPASSEAINTSATQVNRSN